MWSILGLLLGDLLARLGLGAQGDLVVATTSVLDGVVTAGAHADGDTVVATASLIPGQVEVEKPHVPGGGPPWPAPRRPRPRRPFEEIPIAAFADGDLVVATASIIAGQTSTPPPIRIPGAAPGAFLIARASLAATGRVTAWPDFIDPTIRQQNEQLLDLVMLIALIDDDVRGRDERK